MTNFHKSIETLFTFYPMVPVTICMMLGIYTGHLCWENLEVWPMLGGTMGCIVLVGAFWKFPTLHTLMLLSAFFLLGTALSTYEERGMECTLPEGYAYCKGVVVEEPVATDKYIRADIVLSSEALQGRTVRTYLYKGEDTKEIGVGDGVEMEVRLRKPQALGNGNFNYPLYLKGRGIVAIGHAYAKHWQRGKADWGVLSTVQRVRLKALLQRHRLVERYKELGIVGDGLAVASAMTLGDKSAISNELRQTYAATGTSHILALSGMHLGIIYTLLLFLTMGRSHSMVRIVVLLLAVWAFVLLVGLSPSVIRAAVMLTVYSLVTLSTRQPTSVNTLALTAMLMLMVRPLSLFDLAFQLSFVAVVAIVVFGVPIGRLVPSKFQLRHPWLRYVWQLAVMSTIAQMATAPLSIYYFGQTSLYFLLANLVVIPTATLILYSAVAVFLLTPFPLLCQPLANVMGFAAETLNMVLAWMATLPGVTLSGLQVSTFQFVLLQSVSIALLWATVIGVRILRDIR